MFTAIELEMWIDRIVCERLTEVRAARAVQRAQKIAQAERTLARLGSELGAGPAVSLRGHKHFASECG